jgi:hypothetical protein
MAQLEQTADRQIPLLRRLRTAAPSLERFLTELEPFSKASRVSLRALGETAKTGQEALTESREEIQQLRQLSTNAPRMAKPLRQFLQLLDERDRSIENDPLAKETTDPNDKEPYKDGQGFTGMEALINYIYWQTLGINAFDNVSHVLRIALLNSATCGPYEAAPTPTEIKECNAWLGPYQPGIDRDGDGVVENPDPTDEADAPANAQRKREAKARRDRGEAPKPGDPERPPIPGQPDPSKPEIVIPAPVRELLEQLPQLGAKLPDASQLPTQGGRGPTTDQLLDFLLAP